MNLNESGMQKSKKEKFCQQAKRASLYSDLRESLTALEYRGGGGGGFLDPR